MSLPPGGTLRTKKTVAGYPYTPPESGGRCFIQLFRMAEPAGQAQYITSYSFSTNPNTTYLGTTLLKPNGYSPDLKWEQTTTYTVAIDFGFLNNRINGSIEYYQKHTKDLLNTISAAAGTNFINLITANVGKMKNKGVEANVNAAHFSVQ